MRVKTLQILWHYTVADVEGGPEKQPKNKPIFSANVYHNGLLFTAGADRDIKIWQVGRDEVGDPTVTFVSNISGHSGGVNCLRFSPLGDYLASASDSGEVVLWQRRSADAEQSKGLPPGAAWRQCGQLPGCKEVQDLAWAPDGTALLTGSVENQALVWDVQKRRHKRLLEDHVQYVQGVSWDPLGQYVATQSNDRTCKLYSLKPPGAQGGPASSTSAHLAPNLVLKATLVKAATSKEPKGTTPGGPSEDATKRPAAKQILFKDETLHTFFRRLTWSPEGSVLVVPTGQYQAPGSSRLVDVAYVYARGHWSQPVAALPVPSRAVVAVRFCPLAFALRPGSAAGPCRLPYRMVFAVATLESVILYDTQSLCALLVAGPLHLAPCTDLAWAPDGSYLAITSEDGYCSIVAFDKGELGEVLPQDALPAVAADCLGQAAAHRTLAAARQAAAEAEAAAAVAAAAAAARAAGTQHTPANAPAQAASAPAPASLQPQSGADGPVAEAPAPPPTQPSPASASGSCKRKLEEVLQSPPAPAAPQASIIAAPEQPQRLPMRRIVPLPVPTAPPTPAEAPTAAGPSSKLRRIQPTPVPNSSSTPGAPAPDATTTALPSPATATATAPAAPPSASPAATPAAAARHTAASPAQPQPQLDASTPLVGTPGAQGGTPAAAVASSCQGSGGPQPRRITPMRVEEAAGTNLPMQ